MAGRRAKIYRVFAYNGNFRLADRVASPGTGRQMVTFPITKQGTRDAALFILDFMRHYLPEPNRDKPAHVRIEEARTDGSWSVVGKAIGRGGAWAWEDRPEWMPP